MVKIKVSLHYVLHSRLGAEEVEVPVEGSLPLREVLRRLCESRPEVEELLFEDGRLRGDLIFMVNGIGINHLSGEETEVKDTDEVTVVPAIAGG
ncbi:MAG: MoaD/ThiS family protein [Euryarchaeota archaeon]|nr:MoaD/ThiS family protein [Euryarchaeota archaeon]